MKRSDPLHPISRNGPEEEATALHPIRFEGPDEEVGTTGDQEKKRELKKKAERVVSPLKIKVNCLRQHREK